MTSILVIKSSPPTRPLGSQGWPRPPAVRSVSGERARKRMRTGLGRAESPRSGRDDASSQKGRVRDLGPEPPPGRERALSGVDVAIRKEHSPPLPSFDESVAHHAFDHTNHLRHERFIFLVPRSRNQSPQQSRRSRADWNWTSRFQGPPDGSARWTASRPRCPQRPARGRREDLPRDQEQPHGQSATGA